MSIRNPGTISTTAFCICRLVSEGVQSVVARLRRGKDALEYEARVRDRRRALENSLCSKATACAINPPASPQQLRFVASGVTIQLRRLEEAAKGPALADGDRSNVVANGPGAALAAAPGRRMRAATGLKLFQPPLRKRLAPAGPPLAGFLRPTIRSRMRRAAR